jgi:hypothetical protein
MTHMSRRLLVVNVVLIGLAAFFAISLIHDLTRSQPLPSPATARRAATPAAGNDAVESSIPSENLAAYNVIASKPLFNPQRSEGAPAPAAPVAPPPPKPMLLGVLVDGARSRAYLEDATTKRVLSYQIGDSVSGGRLDQITDDKVVIVRADGPIDVLLRDPAKPRPAAPPATAPAATGSPIPTIPTAQQPTSPIPRVEGAGPGRAPIPPRAVRRLPADQSQEPPQPPQQ